MNQILHAPPTIVMGGIYQIYGIAFFSLGIVLCTLPKESTIFRCTKYFYLLGAFGILHGIVEFLAFQQLYISDKKLVYASSILLLLSFIPLFEFGRRFGTAVNFFPKIPAFIVYSVITFGIISQVLLVEDFSIGIATGARIFVGFPASMGWTPLDYTVSMYQTDTI